MSGAAAKHGFKDAAALFKDARFQHKCCLSMKNGTVGSVGTMSLQIPAND